MHLPGGDAIGSERCSMIGVQAPAPTSQWLLLDVPGAPRAAATLQQRFTDARRFWLFEGTEFHPLREQGPVLIELQDCPALIERCCSEPHTWQGLLVVSEVSTAPLLAHLRRMLTVTLGLHYRALLSYYNPHCASYFFDACDAEELSRWLGPIARLRWFGGTWADRATGSQGWQQLLNPGLAVSRWRSKKPSVLASGKNCKLACWSNMPGTGADPPAPNTTDCGPMCRRAWRWASANARFWMAGYGYACSTPVLWPPRLCRGRPNRNSSITCATGGRTINPEHEVSPTWRVLPGNCSRC